MAVPRTGLGVLALYSEASRQKIKRYLGQQDLEFTTLGIGDGVSTTVLGSSAYRVLFDPNTINSLEDILCSCPANGICVHAAVAWMAWLQQNPDFLPGPGDDLKSNQDPPRVSSRSLVEKQGAPVLKLHPLKEEEPQPVALRPASGRNLEGESLVLQSWVMALDQDPGSPRKPSQEPWMPILCFVPGETGFMVQLSLVYLKKDGSHGRIKEWKMGLATLTPHGDDAYWVAMVGSLGGSMDIDRFYLLAMGDTIHPKPRLFTQGGETLRVVDVGSLEFILEPAIETWGPQEVRWHGRLLATDIQGISYHVVHQQRGARNLYFCLKNPEYGEGILGLMDNEVTLGSMVREAMRPKVSFDHGEVMGLEALFEANPIDGFTLRVHGKTCTSVKVRGIPRLVLSMDRGIWGRGPELAIINFIIDWDLPEGVPGKGQLDAQWQRYLQVQGDQGIFYERDIDWEGRVLLWLEQKLEANLDRLSDQLHPFYRQGKTVMYRSIPTPGARGKILQLDEGRDLYYKGSTKDFLEVWGRILIEEGFTLALDPGAPPSTKGTLTIRVDQGLDWLDLEPTVELQVTSTAPGAKKRAARRSRIPDMPRRAELLAVQDLLKEGFLRDVQGRLILLSKGDQEKLMALLDMGLAPRGSTRISKHNLSVLAAIPDDVSNDIPIVFNARDLLTRISSMDEEYLLDPSVEFQGQLRGYQRRGYSWLYHHAKAGLGACLADDMGLGKTVQTLALIQKLHEEGLSTSTLIIAPLSTQANWEAETGRFTPNLRVVTHAGPRRASTIDALTETCANHHITLVSYGTLRSDMELFKKQSFDLIILDEAQHIKNPDSLVFKAVRSLQAKARISLTGTPIENTLYDLWSQMDFLNPGLLGTLKYFSSRWAFGVEERSDQATMAQLRTITRPFLLRRRKEEVARELPPREDSVIYCDLDTEQRRVYQDILDACRLKVDEAIKKNGISRAGITILEALLRLRQACLFPGLINSAWEAVPSAKLAAYNDLMEELIAEDHKALVFSQFTGVLDRLEGENKARGLPYVRLDGQSTKRGELIDTFNNDEAKRIFLLSLKAGGVGINLTSADYVILFDPWWNPAAESQAIDRAHRIGQTRSVFVYRLVARDTVEEKILKLQERKRDLATNLFDQNDDAMAQTSPEELLQLLG